MRRAFTVMAVVAAMTMVTADGAMAASAHFKKGGSPTCTIGDSGLHGFGDVQGRADRPRRRRP